MKNLLIKELRLAASPFSFIFLAFVFMTLLPGYPILMSSFFICLGLYHSFLNTRETNDIIYTVMLPVEKKDLVRAKYAFTCSLQITAFLLCAVLTAVRMTVLSARPEYTENALMNANPVFLAFILLIFAAFNIIFVGSFFKTAYKIGIPYLLFCIAGFVMISVAEALPHIPGCEFLQSPAGERLGLQFTVLICAAVIYAAATFISCRVSEKRFEKIDL